MLTLIQIEAHCQENVFHLHYDFFDDTIDIKTDSTLIVSFTSSLSEEAIESFYTVINAAEYQPVVDTLLAYKAKNKLSDWLYYQLIRKTAQQIAPKADNYLRYTLYKWFLLAKSGYDAALGMGKDELLFYVRSDENIYDIPFFRKDGRQYVCLNSHDYGKIDFDNDPIREVAIKIPEGKNSFSYKVTSIPDFKPADYVEKDLQFVFHDSVYHFPVMMNPQVQNIFANYPIVDFESYFNIPLSSETYSSLIPLLKKNISGMRKQEGVDYLMRFTRYAFLYENDQDNFGKEKRLSPEQTLLNQYSDCDDRVGLFFYLVKEIYNLPMIALLYPTHITMAVKFDTPVGKSVTYNGNKYSICDPTPQIEDLRIGQLSPGLHNTAFQVVYEYYPRKKK
ncbi:hypothetical protein BH11BAC6_BH11BAC6_04270 [soil metagenome]